MLNKIIGMKISQTIMFDGDLSNEDKCQYMCLIENEIERAVLKLKDVVPLGGTGKWIYEQPYKT